MSPIVNILIRAVIENFHLPGEHDQQNHAGGENISRLETKARTSSVAEQSESRARKMFDHMYGRGSEYEFRERVFADWTQGVEQRRSMHLEAAVHKLWGGGVRKANTVFFDKTGESLYGTDDFITPGNDEQSRDNVRRAYMQLAKKQYELTQNVIRELHPERTVTLYRGTKNKTGFVRKSNTTIKTGALSSWTTDIDIARDFAGDKKARVIAIRVPVEDIFAAPFSMKGLSRMGESEYLLLGRGKEREFRVVE